MRVVVFTGPSLSHADAAQLRPDAEIRPPARRGDLVAARLVDGDTAIILDGYYFSVPTLQHAEILETMRRGVTVVGASSLGALRAAELRDAGMIGVGDVYRAYASGELVGDDEVAVLHDADAYRMLSLPLVNVRATLAREVACSRVAPECADHLLHVLRSCWFGDRTAATVRMVLRRSRWADAIPAVLAALAAPIDLKRDDAAAALALGCGPLHEPRRPPSATTVFGHATVREHGDLALDLDLAVAWTLVHPSPRAMLRRAGCRGVLRRLGLAIPTTDGRALEDRARDALVAAGLLAPGADADAIDCFVLSPRRAPGVRASEDLAGLLHGCGQLALLGERARRLAVREPPTALARLLAPLPELWRCTPGDLIDEAARRGLAWTELLHALRRPKVWTLVRDAAQTRRSRTDGRDISRTRDLH